MMMYGSETSPSLCSCSVSPPWSDLRFINSVFESLLKIISPLFISPCLCTACPATSPMCGFSPEKPMPTSQRCHGHLIETKPKSESYPASGHSHKTGRASRWIRISKRLQKVRFWGICVSLQLLLPKNTSKVLEPNSASPVLLKGDIDLQKCILTSGAEFHNDKCFTRSKYPKKNYLKKTNWDGWELFWNQDGWAGRFQRNLSGLQCFEIIGN